VSASLRKFRAFVYDYDDTGTAGEMASTYQLHASSAADGAWWCSKAQPTGREVTTGMRPEHRVDAVLGFSAYAPVTENGAVVVDSVQYLVRAILARDYGRDEVQVYAEKAPEQTAGGTLDLLSGIARTSQVVAEVMVAA
jgi:hypothetical protein